MNQSRKETVALQEAREVEGLNHAGQGLKVQGPQTERERSWCLTGLAPCGWVWGGCVLCAVSIPLTACAAAGVGRGGRSRRHRGQGGTASPRELTRGTPLPVRPSAAAPTPGWFTAIPGAPPSQAADRPPPPRPCHPLPAPRAGPAGTALPPACRANVVAVGLARGPARAAHRRLPGAGQRARA